MSFISNDEIQGKRTPNLAPMIDFLFLMLMFFASLAISRITTRDTEVDLVKIPSTSEEAIAQTNNPDFQVINITVNNQGQYKWTTEIHDYPMDTPEQISNELLHQYEQGLLPEEKLKTLVFLRIDREAKWEPILKVILAIRDSGFNVHPLYEEKELGSMENKQCSK